MPYKDPAARAAWKAKWYREHQEERRAYKRKYRAENLEACRAYCAKWARDNRARMTKNRRLSRAAKAKAKSIADRLLARAAELARMEIQKRKNGYLGRCNLERI